MRLQGKVAIVTGGASGFGAGIARNRQVGSVMSQALSDKLDGQAANP